MVKGKTDLEGLGVSKLFSLKIKQTNIERKHRLSHPSLSAIRAFATENTELMVCTD